MRIFNDLGMTLDIGGHAKFGEVQIAPVAIEGALTSERIATLDELMPKGLVRVGEHDDGADVQEVSLENASDSFLAVFDNDIIEGAMQNRVAQSTFIVGAGQKCTAPVLCVEAGRWGYKKAKEFKHSNSSMGPRMRMRKLDMLKAEESPSAMQDMVWDEVDKLSFKLDTSSRTKNLTSVLKKKSFSAEKELVDFIGGSNCHGFCVLAGRHRFLEIFWDRKVCASQAGKSVRSWLADAAKEGVGHALDDDALRAKFVKGEWSPVKATGLENAFHADSKLKGRATLLGTGFVHAVLEF